jgi:hypothetical protein
MLYQKLIREISASGWFYYKKCFDKIPSHALGPQAKPEGPHCYEEEANRALSKRIILAIWKEVATINRKQALDTQNNYKTDLDIWHRNLGLCQ